jgi:hypothetical protein
MQQAQLQKVAAVQLLADRGAARHTKPKKEWLTPLLLKRFCS